jgi:hypothetical protein
MNYSKLYNLECCDRIVEPLFQTGLSKHHSIFLGADNHGRELVAENNKLLGVRLVNASDYFSNIKAIDRVEKFLGSEAERKTAFERALSLIGRPYDLFKYNCEHYANEVQTGKPISLQVRNFFIIVAIIMSIWLFFKWNYKFKS